MEIIPAKKAYDVSTHRCTSTLDYTYSLEDVVAEAITINALHSKDKCRIKVTKSFHKSDEFDTIMDNLKNLGYDTRYSEDRADVHSNFIYRGSQDTDTEFGVIIINWGISDKDSSNYLEEAYNA